MAAPFRDRVSPVVPAGAGGYAPEEIVFAGRTATDIGQFSITGLTVLIEATVATAVYEIWLLKLNGDPTNAAHYFNSGLTITNSTHVRFAEVEGVKVRSKSGGTGGTAILNAWAEQKQRGR